MKLAAGYTDDVEFSAQDATRTELDFLLECFDVAVKAGATTINVPDTVGYATPAEFGELVRIVRERSPEHVVISTHCHNDLGLAAVPTRSPGGERRAPGRGRRERDRRARGHCSLEEIAMIVRTRSERSACGTA